MTFSFGQSVTLIVVALAAVAVLVHQPRPASGAPTAAAAAAASLGSHPHYPPERKRALRDRVVHLFRHGYDSYINYAFPLDELKPLSCSGTDHFGGYTLTLIDSLDMLALIGDDEEFMKQVKYIAQNVSFNKDKRVSVFETTIRVIGGLISGHIIAERLVEKHRSKYDGHEHGEKRLLFTYNGELLDKAVDIATRLLPAFNTPTGIPYNEVNLIHGIDRSKGHTTCPAAAGSLLLEFGVLSALTGNCTFVTLARRALEGVWKHRSPHNLVGTMIDVLNGKWTNGEANIGASIDSFYEYIYKAYVLFDDQRYLDMWDVAYKAIQKYTFHSGWYVSSSVDFQGPLQHSDHKFNSLQAFWPGLQVIAGDVGNALQSYEKMYCIVRDLRFMPEYVHIESYLQRQPHARKNGPGYPLRPEFLESTFYLYHATGEERLLHIAEEFLDNLELTKQRCGFAAVVDVFEMRFEDKMDSFVLAETFKYLYMIFSPTKSDVAQMRRDGTLEVLYPDGSEHQLYDLHLDWIVNTEAHPIEVNQHQRDVYHSCLAQASHVMMRDNDPRLIADGYVLHGSLKSYERVGGEKSAAPLLERQRQCPVIDYMRDVAPAFEHLLDRERCYSHLQFSTIGREGASASAAGGGGGSSQHGHQYRSTNDGGGGVQQFQLPVYLEADPLRMDSTPINLVLSYSARKKLETETFRSIVSIPSLQGTESLYMPQHSSFVFVWDGTNSTLLFTGMAQFGPSPCGRGGGDGAGGGHVIDDPATSEFGRVGIDAAPLVHLHGNGCASSELLSTGGAPGSGENTNSIDASLLSFGAAADLVATIRAKRRRSTAEAADAAGAAAAAAAEESPRFGIVIRRGGCVFKEKVLTAEALGASFVLIYNSEPNGGVSTMADAPSQIPGEPKIPSWMISYEDAQRLKLIADDGGGGSGRGIERWDDAEVNVALPPKSATGISHLTPLSPVSIICARNSYEQFRAMGALLVSDAEPTVAVHLLRPRLAPVLPVARRRLGIKKVEMQAAGGGGGGGDNAAATSIDIWTLFAPGVQNQGDHAMRGRLCLRCRFVVAMGNSIEVRSVTTHDSRVTGLFDGDNAALRFIVDDDVSRVPPEIDLQTRQLISRQVTWTAEAGRAAIVIIAPGAASAGLWRFAELQVFTVKRIADFALMFSEAQAELHDAISAHGAEWGIAGYMLGVDTKSGRVFELLVTTSQEARDRLRRGDYHLFDDILPFHTLLEMRNMLVNADERLSFSFGKHADVSL